jgi:hypothetical protein
MLRYRRWHADACSCGDRIQCSDNACTGGASAAFNHHAGRTGRDRGNDGTERFRVGGHGRTGYTFDSERCSCSRAGSNRHGRTRSRSQRDHGNAHAIGQLAHHKCEPGQLQFEHGSDGDVRGGLGRH